MAFDISNFTTAQVNAKAVDVAISLCGVHGQRYGRMASERDGLDCIGLIERVAAEIGAPVSIDRNWQDNGGELPIVEISLHLAEPGDVLVFDMGANNPAFRRFQLGILSQGSVVDARAQFIGVPHAVAPVWLNAGPWKTALVRAYRFGPASPTPAMKPSSDAPLPGATGSEAQPFTINAALLADPDQLSTLIDALIARMDAMTGDPDVEPSLGSVGSNGIDWAQGVTDEREVECEDEGADGGGDYDAWLVNPYSPNQAGNAWINGVTNPDAYVRHDDMEAA